MTAQPTPKSPNPGRRDAGGPSTHLALDLGATNGRAMLGTLAGGRLHLVELHRFPNEILDLNGRLHWNILSLYEESRPASAPAPRKGHQPQSLGVDAWGVDFGLLDASGELAGIPVSYRDSRTEGAMEQFFHRVPRHRVLRTHGHPVPRAEHPLSGLLPRPRPHPRPQHRLRPALPARSAGLPVDGREILGIHHRLYLPDAQRSHPRLGAGTLRRPRPPRLSHARPPPARHGDRSVAQGGRARGGPATRPHCRRQPRHGVRGGGGSGRRSRLGLHQLRHVVAHGRRERGADHLTAGPRAQLH